MHRFGSDFRRRRSSDNARTPLRSSRPGNRSMLVTIGAAVLPRKRRRYGSPFLVRKRHDEVILQRCYRLQYFRSYYDSAWTAAADPYMICVCFFFFFS